MKAERVTHMDMIL